MNTVLKKHDSCVRVLEFLKLLLDKDISTRDINKTLDGYFCDIGAPETFLKYINTLEASGFSIKKTDKKYSIQSVLTQIDFTDKEIELLQEIYKEFNNCCVEKNREDFNNFFANISKITSNNDKSKSISSLYKEQNINKTEEQNISQKSERYQQYIDLGQRIKIQYKGETITAEPIDIETENEKLYFIVYNTTKACNISIYSEDIENITILPTKTNSYRITEAIAFEIYDRLKVNYRLRENEHVQSYNENHKVIINCGEDKKQLIRRLLRYGENCKIVSPKYVKEEYLKELSKIKAKIQGVIK